MFDCHYQPSIGNIAKYSVYFFVDILHVCLFVFNHFSFCLLSNTIYMEMSLRFFNARSLKSFQKAAHHLVFSVESFFWVISPISSLSRTNVAAIFCAAHLCNTRKALQLHHQFLGNNVCCRSWICFGGFSEWESDPGWTSSVKVNRGYVASRRSSQPISHFSNCVCRHLCLRRFSNWVKALNDFQTRITKSVMPLNCFATCC